MPGDGVGLGVGEWAKVFGLGEESGGRVEDRVVSRGRGKWIGCVEAGEDAIGDDGRIRCGGCVGVEQI